MHIKHFRSVADQTIDLSDMTILVGQNATGKSNVVDAVRFMRDALADGLDQAVSIRNGVRVVRQASQSKKPFNIELKLEYKIEDRRAHVNLFNESRAIAHLMGLS
ncbi:AAA family ATPase [Pseudoxanthomonas sp. NC8]|nr:AAA family ATPase [Pseudoxanthomonas sp. NC8]